VPDPDPHGFAFVYVSLNADLDPHSQHGSGSRKAISVRIGFIMLLGSGWIRARMAYWYKQQIRKKSYLGHLVVDLRWVGSALEMLWASVASARSVHQSRKSLGGCKHSVSVPSVGIFKSSHRH
jgi:hypothetical protein